jgi:hypothetical protein
MRWRRTNDESSREQEMLYINQLTPQRSCILEKWGLACAATRLKMVPFPINRPGFRQKMRPAAKNSTCRFLKFPRVFLHFSVGQIKNPKKARLRVTQWIPPSYT